MKYLHRIFCLAAICTLRCTASGQSTPAKTFISKEGRFSILLPSRPVFSKEKLSDSSNSGYSYTYLIDQKDTAYYVSYADFDPVAIKSVSATKVLDGARDGGVSNSKGKLLSETNLSLDGNPGREIVIDSQAEPNLKTKARFYLVGNRLYTTLFTGPPAAADSASTEKFLTSLKVTKPMELPNSWISLEPAGGRFKIKMPTKPDGSLDKSDKNSPVHLWQLGSPDANYFVTYNDLSTDQLPIGKIEEALAAGRDAVAKAMSARILGESLLSVDGNPGLEVQLMVGEKDTPTEMAILFRGFIVTGRYYQVMVMTTKEGKAKARIDEFMDSFQLVPSPPVKKP